MIMEFWYWWVLALLFLGLELLISGFFFLWIASAAVVTGIVALVFVGLELQGQMMSFSLLAVLALLLWKVYRSKSFLHTTDQPLLNKRGAQYIGRVFVLIEPIHNGQGKVRVDDTFWKVCGPDCLVGTKVRVIALQGIVFEVEPVSE